jgi:hypothetical protein
LYPRAFQIGTARRFYKERRGLKASPQTGRTVHVGGVPTADIRDRDKWELCEVQELVAASGWLTSDERRTLLNIYNKRIEERINSALASAKDVNASISKELKEFKAFSGQLDEATGTALDDGKVGWSRGSVNRYSWRYHRKYSFKVAILDEAFFFPHAKLSNAHYHAASCESVTSLHVLASAAMPAEVENDPAGDLQRRTYEKWLNGRSSFARADTTEAQRALVDALTAEVRDC